MKSSKHRALRRSIITLAAIGLVAASCGSDAKTTPSAAPSAPAATTAAPSATSAPATPGSSAAATTQPAGSTPSTGAGLRVAVILPSAANDLSFSQSMADALNRMKDAGLISELKVSENMFVVDDAAAAIRSYAQDGFDIVIAHGSQYGGSLQQIAPDFPKVAFAWGTAADTFGLPNVTGYSAASDEGGYVMGVMGAMLAKGASMGVIGPIEVGDAKLYNDGFAAGAKAQDPTVNVGVNYTESFSDTALAAEAATSFVTGGAKALTGSSQMTVGAVGVAKNSGIPWFATNSNQTQLAPDVVVASQVYKWDVVLKQLFDKVKSGSYGGESYEINLANGGEVIEFNDAYKLPADVKAAGEKAIAGITDGSIKTGVAGS
jgi:basic membrane lipoprotein Med (substrate-binding protein (PBP1-ABC) superfamily)